MWSDDEEVQGRTPIRGFKNRVISKQGRFFYFPYRTIDYTTQDY